MTTESALPSEASFYEDELSDADRATLAEGKPVVHTEDLDESDWPGVTVYRFAAGKPIHFLVTFVSYPQHPKIFCKPGSRDGIVACSLSRVISPVTFEIDYTLAYPTVLGVSIADQHFTTRNTLKRLGRKAYAVEWHLVRETVAMTDLRWKLRVQAHGSGSALSYAQSVWLNKATGTGRLLSLFKKHFIQEMIGSLNRLIEFTSQRSQGELETLMEEARRAYEALPLAGEDAP